MDLVGTTEAQIDVNWLASGDHPSSLLPIVSANLISDGLHVFSGATYWVLYVVPVNLELVIERWVPSVLCELLHGEVSVCI